MVLPVLRVTCCVSVSLTGFPAVVVSIVLSRFLVVEANFRPIGKKRA